MFAEVQPKILSMTYWFFAISSWPCNEAPWWCWFMKVGPLMMLINAGHITALFHFFNLLGCWTNECKGSSTNFILIWTLKYNLLSFNGRRFISFKTRKPLDGTLCKVEEITLLGYCKLSYLGRAVWEKNLANKCISKWKVPSFFLTLHFYQPASSK